MNDFKVFYKFSTAVDKRKNVSPAYLKKPIIVGLVETDKDSKLKSNSDCFRYFKLPKRQDYPLDLNIDIENYSCRSDHYFKCKLRNVFHYLIAHHDDGDVKNERTNHHETNRDEREVPNTKFDIVSHRGALAELLITPLKLGKHFKQEWTIYATCFNNELYLQKFEERDDNVRENFHFKFAQHCFTDDPDRDPDTSVPIHEDEQMYCIYRSQLKNLNLLYSAEINGIIADKKLENVQDFKQLNQCRFVYTKLMKNTINNWRKNFRIQSWWAKSYFSAVNDIYVGFRNDLGVVDEPVEHVILHKLVQKQWWSPKECCAFLYKILTKIIEEVRDVNCPYTTYEFHFDSGTQCIEFKKHEGKTEKTFLTDEYIEFIRKN